MAGCKQLRLLFSLARLGLVLTVATSSLSAAPGEVRKPLSALTESDRAWIAGNREVLVGFTESFPPYSQTQPDGKLQGIDLDYLDLIATRTGLTFKPVIFKEWNQAEAALKEGRIDLLTGLIRTAEREAYMLFSLSYIQAPDVVVTRIDMPYVLNEAELRGLTIGRVRGYASDLLNKDKSWAIRIVDFDNINDVFEALSRGTIDATITDTVNASYTIRLMHLTNLRMGSVIGGPGDTYFGINRMKPQLKNVIDQALQTITSAEQRAIDDRWIAVEAAPSKWLLAFKWAAGLGLATVVLFVLLYLHNRRLTVELNERIRIQRQLEDTHMKLARVSEEKSEVMRIVAHDLRSPLTGLGLAAEILLGEKEQLSPGGQEMLPKMLDSIRLMRRMVDDLVDVHLLEEGLQPYALSDIELNVVVRQSVDAFAGTARNKGIQLTCLLPANPVRILSNSRALRQVLDNLVSNALKYSPASSEVRIVLQTSGQGCQLRVCDQGPGVKESEREQIFEKYGRGSASPTGGEKSTGLGLWIVWRIVQSLQGKVWLEPAEGKTGSVFVVEFYPQPPVS